MSKIRLSTATGAIVAAAALIMMGPAVVAQADTAYPAAWTTTSAVTSDDDPCETADWAHPPTLSDPNGHFPDLRDPIPQWQHDWCEGQRKLKEFQHQAHGKSRQHNQ
jgi:hypothetical protein